MTEIITVMTRKGQITVPAELRRIWDLKEGDKIAVGLADEDAAYVTLRPIRSVADMTYGAFKSHLPPGNPEAWRRQFEDAIVDEYLAETPSLPSEQH